MGRGGKEEKRGEEGSPAGREWRRGRWARTVGACLPGGGGTPRSRQSGSHGGLESLSLRLWPVWLWGVPWVRGKVGSRGRETPGRGPSSHGISGTREVQQRQGRAGTVPTPGSGDPGAPVASPPPPPPHHQLPIPGRLTPQLRGRGSGNVREGAGSVLLSDGL